MVKEVKGGEGKDNKTNRDGMDKVTKVNKDGTAKVDKVSQVSKVSKASKDLMAKEAKVGVVKVKAKVGAISQDNIISKLQDGTGRKDIMVTVMDIIKPVKAVKVLPMDKGLT